MVLDKNQRVYTTKESFVRLKPTNKVDKHQILRDLESLEVALMIPKKMQFPKNNIQKVKF